MDKVSIWTKVNVQVDLELSELNQGVIELERQKASGVRIRHYIKLKMDEIRELRANEERKDDLKRNTRYAKQSD